MPRKNYVWFGAVFVFVLLVCPGRAEEAKTEGVEGGGTRVVHFPEDRSLGALMIRSAETSDTLTHWWWGHFTEWEYLCEARGNVTVPAGKPLGLIVSSSGRKDLSPLANLRPDDLDMLAIECERRDAEKPGDECMQYLSHLTGLKMLVLQYPDFSNESLKSLKGLKSLTKLSLISEQLDDSGMAHIAKLKSLEGLRFYSKKVTNTGLSHISKLARLEELFLPQASELDGDGLIHITKLPKLRYLVLSDKNFTDVGLLHLQKYPSLKELDFLWPPISETWVTNLSKLTKLERLYINGPITDEDLSQLKSMRSLKELRLQRGTSGRGVFITDTGLADLKHIKSLESIELYYARCTDEGLAHLCELEKLRCLVIPNCHKFTDVGLSYIAKLRNLEELHIGAERFTDEGMDHIASLINLRSLILGRARSVTNAGLGKLTELKSLQKLILGTPKVSTAGLNQLNVLTCLRELDADDIGKVDAVLDIAGLTNLENLTLPAVRDEDLVCLSKLKRLKWLEIRGHGTITDAGIAHLAGLASLDMLMFIGNQNLTDKGLSYIANMKSLNYLTINGDFSDEGLRQLEGLKGLRNLRIVSRNPVGPTALQRLRENLPNIAGSSLKTEISEVIRLAPKVVEAQSLVGKALPGFEGIEIEFDAEQAKGKEILVCFFDMEQRPSRHCIRELAKKAEQLKEKGITIVAVQASKVDKDKLDKWVEENNIGFAVGMIGGDEEKTRFSWGVKSLPWLILTDKEHIVRAEGFGLREIENESASDIVLKFQKTTSTWPKAFAIEAESYSDVTEDDQKSEQFLYKYRYRRDHEATDVGYSKFKIDEEGKYISEPIYRNRAIIGRDGEAISYYGSDITPKDVIFTINSSKKEADYTRAQLNGAQALDGYLAGDDVFLSELLIAASDLKLHDRMESIDGVECYIVEAHTDHGHYTVWFDPTHGYLPRRAVVEKRADDIYSHNRHLSDTPLSEFHFTMDSVKFKNVDGTFIPIECELNEDWHTRGHLIKIRRKYKRTKIEFHPDFDVIGAFKPEIPNGTRVNHQDFVEAGISFEWYNGRPIALVDDLILNDIETVAEQLMREISTGKPLPGFEGIDIEFNAEQAKGKKVLFCFFDMSQRPSRHCVRELAKKAEQLKEKGVSVVAVQVSKVDKNTLSDWVKKYNIDFAVGIIEGDEEKTKLSWGVKSLPWLILTDKEHVVRAEGFGLGEVEAKVERVEGGGVRVVHFPKDRSIGVVYIRDKGMTGDEKGWEKLGDAQDEVVVDKGKEVRLNVTDDTIKNLSYLSTIGPDELENLSIYSQKLNDTDLKYIKNLTGLQRLILLGPITGEGLVNLQGMQCLKELYLLRTQVDDNNLSHLQFIDTLEELRMWNNSRITGVGFSQLKNLKSLKRIGFYQTPISDEGMKYISQMKTLEDLSLQSTKVTEKGLEYLKGLPKLKILVLPPGTTDKGLANLKEVKTLEKLDIVGTKVSDEGLICLKDMKSLKSLRISSNKMTGEGLIYLRDIGLEDLLLSLKMINDDGLSNVKDLPVTSLNLGGTIITDAGLAHIAGLKTLESLHLDSTNITDDGLAHLTGLTSLQYLGLKDTQISDIGLGYLGKMTSLKVLKFHGTKISDVGLKHLKNLSQLETLYLTRTQISDMGLNELKGMANLRYLSLFGCEEVSDAVLAYLRGLDSLDVLNLKGTQVTPGGAEVIRQALQKCTVEGVGETVQKITSKDISRGMGMIGKSAPKLGIGKLLQAPEGTVASWEKLKGKVVVLEFWATWCGPCVKAFPHINSLADKFKNKPVRFICITDETEPVVTDFLGRYLLKTWVALDTDRSIFESYQIKGRPRTVVVNPEGRIISVGFPMDLTEDVINNALGLPKAEEVKQPRKELEAEPKVSGMVGDTEGRPVAGAQVAALPMSNRHVLTDAGGKFEIGWKREWAGDIADICLMARHVEHNLAALVDITHETKTIDIKLEPSLTLTGTVVDTNGMSISRAKVNLSLRGAVGWSSYGTPVRGVVTDGQGRYEFGALPQRQDYSISARADGYWYNEITTGVINRVTARAEVGQIILKKPNMSVSGVVVDDTGKAVPNISVFVFICGEDHHRLNGQTDREGKFKFEKICSGPINIIAKSKTLVGIIETQGGAQDVKLVVSARW
ncbi:MAG: leucine-rich repeat domain-containing protein [Planctomycetota bacterium]|jgi:peroxiredoxin/Leucine-rich repeat (LRR) protein